MIDESNDFNENLLRPIEKVLKYIGMPILGLLGFVLFAFMRGLSGHKFYAQMPTVIKLGFPLWLILLMMLAFFIIIYLLIRFYQYSGIDYHTFIKISKTHICIDSEKYMIKFENKLAKQIRYSECLILSFFYKHYSIGKLRINYKDDKYCYYFPVKNPSKERQLKKWFSND